MPSTAFKNVVALNADLGEGFGNWTVDDAELLAMVTDANIACGFHAGDPDTMARTCDLAAQYGVNIGAHVGFDDLRGFGRRYIAVPKASLTNDVICQIGALDAFGQKAGIGITYVKPHGALYHSAAQREEHATAIVDAIKATNLNLAVLCQPGSLLAQCAELAGISVIAEGFMDRTYTPAGTLVFRNEPGAVITDAAQAAAQAVQMVTTQTVNALDGTAVAVEVHSLCIHSDSPGAAHLARTVRSALEAAGVEIRSPQSVR
jgi:5-oxoprolinase (ATP-hydrolysing) subunit A